MATTTPRRGEVWLVDLGMVAKIRPCLVVSIPARDENDRVPTTLIPHTTSTRGSRFETPSPNHLACRSAPGGSTKMSKLRHKLLRLKTSCSSDQAFDIPTPLAILMAMCQGPLRLLPYRIACLRGTFIASRFRIRLRTVSTAKRSMGLLVTTPIHSQASFPRSVALAQLPSPRACSLEVVIWYTDLIEIPISHRGLEPHKPMPMTGAPKKMHASCGSPGS